MMNLRNIIASQIVFLGLFVGTASAYTDYYGTGSSPTHGCVYYRFYVRVHYTGVSWPGFSSLEKDSDGIYRGVNTQSSFGESWSITAITYDSSWHEIAEAGAYYSESAYQSFLSQFSLTAPTECVEPNPCEEKEGNLAGNVIATGAYNFTVCEEGCTVTQSVEFTEMSVQIGSPSYTLFTGVYDGSECTVTDDNGNLITPDDPSDPDNEEYPYDRKCEEIKKVCDEICVNGTTTNTCDPTDGSTTCECNNPLYPEDPTETPNKPDEVEKPADDPNASDTEQANKDSIDRVGDILEDQTTQLDAIGKNVEATANNTGELVKAINDGQLSKAVSDGISSGIKDGMDDVEGAVKDVEGELHDIQGDLSDGVYTKEAAPEAITTEEYDFSTRTNDFLSDMGETSLFSVVTDLGSLSGSGSSSIAINGGETFGDHTIDFSAFDIGLNALKYVFHLMGMIIGLRILTLKR